MKCPKCGSPTFTADIDDQKTILCTNDACKWKGAAEIGQCPYGKVVPGGILCDTYEFCEFQAWQLVKDDLCWCTREETLLKRAEAATQDTAGNAEHAINPDRQMLIQWIETFSTDSAKELKDALIWRLKDGLFAPPPHPMFKGYVAGIPEKASPGKASGDVLAELKSLKAWIQSQAKKDPMFHYTGLIAEIEMRERKVQP